MPTYQIVRTNRYAGRAAGAVVWEGRAKGPKDAVERAGIPLEGAEALTSKRTGRRVFALADAGDGASDLYVDEVGALLLARSTRESGAGDLGGRLAALRGALAPIRGRLEPGAERVRTREGDTAQARNLWIGCSDWTARTPVVDAVTRAGFEVVEERRVTSAEPGWLFG